MPAKIFILVAAFALPAIACADPKEASHAAACVAALKAREPVLASALKGGAPVDAELTKVVRSGIAIVGTQYMAGLQEAEAKRLLAAAESDFSKLPPAEAQERQAQCLQEGDRLFQRASPLEQALITHAAQRRIKRLTAA